MLSHPISSTAVDAFTARFGRAPHVLARAPGRVVLLGAHVDYSEGWVLPAAIDRSLWLAAATLPGGKVRIESVDYGQQGEFQLDSLDSLSPTPRWLAYPKGVAWALQSAGHQLQGMTAVVVSDLPAEAGVSSSAAFEIALIMAWEALSGFRLEAVERARLAQRVENEFLGVGSGIMDQFACVHGAANRMILLDCRTFSYEHLLVPDSVAVIISDSGVRRRLTEIDYNSRPDECRQALEILRQHMSGVRTLRDVSKADRTRLAGVLPAKLRMRAQHVIDECLRVNEGAAALRRGDLYAFGALVRQSQDSSRTLYENSIPELDVLAEAAGRSPGCYGSRFAGGGFGGVMQSLVEESAVVDIQMAINEAFTGVFGRSPSMFTCTVSSGAEIAWL